ncbi:MAG: penicillin-binding protein activator [Thermoanaerobaculia bacterium]|nr:penicillin-binding protein activator [Thermoanaerobaculia bacterium]
MRRSLAICSLVAATSFGCGPGEEIEFAAVLPLTGQYEVYGIEIRKGLELALEELQNDTSYPYQLTLDILDSEGDPGQAAELAAQAYSAGAMAIIGGVTTDEALAMVPVADRNDRILVSPSASSPELTGISKNFYRVFPNDQREGTTMGNFAAVKLEIENVVILAKEDAYARGIQEVFKTEFERNGGQVPDVIQYPPGAADFSGLIDRVLTLDPAAVYVAAYAQDVGAMISELRRRGYVGTILTTSAFASPAVIEQVGEPAEGVFLTQAVFEADSDDEHIAAFVSAFRSKFSLSPDLYAAHGYDALKVLAKALEELERPIASDMWKGMRKIKDFPGVTGTIQFDERGDAQKFPRVYVIESGSLVDYEREVEERRKELLDRLRRLEERKKRAAGGG